MVFSGGGLWIALRLIKMIMGVISGSYSFNVNLSAPNSLVAKSWRIFHRLWPKSDGRACTLHRSWSHCFDVERRWLVNWKLGESTARVREAIFPLLAKRNNP